MQPRLARYLEVLVVLLLLFTGYHPDAIIKLVGPATLAHVSLLFSDMHSDLTGNDGIGGSRVAIP